MKRKIYDCFLFSNEIELLEFRMKILEPYIDYFLIVESPFSFQGNKKEMTFNNNKHLFDKYKIIHGVYENLPYVGNVNGKRSRGKKNEWCSRDFMLTLLKDADPEDIILLSDIDEIPNMDSLCKDLHLLEYENLHLLKHKNHHSIGTKMLLFYYYMNYLSTQAWSGTVACKLKNFNKPHKVRKNRGYNAVENGGWHYSYLGGPERIINKMQTLGSTQLNQKKFTDINNIELCLTRIKDVYGRGSIKISKVDTIKYGPDCIGEFIKKYPHFVREDM